MNALNVKTIFKRGWESVLLASFALIAAPAIASSAASPQNVEITSYSNGRATIVGEGFIKKEKNRFQVNFYGNQGFIGDVNTNPNGSFSYTTPAGKVARGDRIEVKVLNWNGNGQHKSHYVTVRSPEPRPTPQPTPTPSPTFRMDPEKLRDYADYQARTVANRVTNTYGELERWKYNFTIGYWSGIDLFADSYEARVHHDNARRDGQRLGERPGYAAGSSSGASQGSSAGGLEAVSRFSAVVNTDALPNLSLGNIALPSFSGLKAPKNACETEVASQTALERKLADEMRIIRFGDEDGHLGYDPTAYSIRFSELNRWGRNTYHFVDSWFRTEYAWNEWLDNDLNGKYSKANYRKLESDQKQEFRRIFEKSYDRVIDEKFHRKKRERNASAYYRGQWYGAEVGKAQAYDRGCNLGYAESYSAASVNGFRETYVASFRSGFQSTSKHYNNNPVVSFEGLQLIDGNGNGIFELGENIGVTIRSVSNLGRVAANSLGLQLSGEGIDGIASDLSVSIEASTSIVMNGNYPNLGRIRMDVIADRSNSVSLSIGGNTHALSYTVGWKLMIQALATTSSSEADSLKQFVLKNIQEEYTRTESAKTNIYRAKEGRPSKLRDLVEFYETLPEGQRGNIRSMAANILAMQEQAKHNKWATGRLRKDFAELAQRLTK